MTRSRAALLVVTGLAAAVLPARAEDAPPAPTSSASLSFATERVVVFKDGFALFVKTGTATADADGRVHTDDVPGGAVLGCFWATSEDRKILGMRAGWVETKAEREVTGVATSTLDLLRANVGRSVVLGLTREKEADVAGTLVAVLDSVPAAELPQPRGTPRPVGPPGTSVRPLGAQGATMVLLDTGAQRLALPIAEVRTVSGAGLVTMSTRREEVTTRSKRLSIDLGPASAGKPSKVRLLYFTEGVRWIPTYRVTGGLEKDAEVSLQGEVMNDAEDFADASLDLVVGVPSFRFKDVVSPLTLEHAMVRALDGRAQQLRGQIARVSNTFSNNFSNAEADVDVFEAGDGTPFSAPAELAREAQQDLYVYGVGKTTMKRGDRAAIPLWQSVAALRHVYTADVVVVRDFRSGAHSYRSAKQQVELSPEASGAVGASGGAPVWHELELANGSDVPWTTGAALVLKGDLPVAQNVLRYTSARSKTLLPLTVAVDLQGKWEEIERERRPNALTWSHATYGLIRKHGTLTVVSRRKEPSAVRVSLSLGGRAEAATEGGVVTLNDVRAADWSSGGAAVNNHSDVLWDVTLAPGETKRLEVDFAFYVQ